MPPTTHKDLVEALDDTAIALLQRVQAQGTVDIGPPPADEDENSEGPKPATLADQVRVFDAVRNWLETRMKVAPPEKEKSRFADIKQRIERGASRRGRSASAAEEEDDSV